MSKYLQESYEDAIRDNALLQAKLDQALAALESVANGSARETMRRYAEDALKAIRGN